MSVLSYVGFLNGGYALASSGGGANADSSVVVRLNIEVSGNFPAGGERDGKESKSLAFGWRSRAFLLQSYVKGRLLRKEG